MDVMAYWLSFPDTVTHERRYTYTGVFLGVFTGRTSWVYHVGNKRGLILLQQDRRLRACKGQMSRHLRRSIRRTSVRFTAMCIAKLATGKRLKMSRRRSLSKQCVEWRLNAAHRVRSDGCSGSR